MLYIFLCTKNKQDPSEKHETKTLSDPSRAFFFTTYLDFIYNSWALYWQEASQQTESNSDNYVLIFFFLSFFFISHCFVLTLVGAKHKSDFQVHLDIQNLILLLISTLHKFNKTFVHFTNNSAIWPWYCFSLHISTAILLKNYTKILIFEKWLDY